MEIKVDVEMGDTVTAGVGNGTIVGRVHGVAQFERKATPDILIEWLDGNLVEQSKWVPYELVSVGAPQPANRGPG